MCANYHVRGLVSGFVRQPIWHARELLRNPAYRALHRFQRALKRLPRYNQSRVTYKANDIHLCDAPSFLSAWDEIFVNKIYDIGEPGDGAPVLVDVGANIGLAALYWKLRYGNFSYIGFEPDRRISECCRKNLGNWGVRGQLHEAAVSDREGLSPFMADGADGGMLIANDGGNIAVSHVKTVRLSAHLPSRVDLLKIDVEGAEGKVLWDIEPLLGGVVHLFIEWHSRTGHAGLGDAIALLERLGFDCHLQVAVGERMPFIAGRVRDRLFQNINIFAVRL